MNVREFLLRHARYILTGFAGIVLLAGLMWLVKDVAKKIIVIPLSYLLWIGDVLFRMVSQSFVWVLFLMIIFIMIIRSVLRSKTGRQDFRPVRKQYFGRVQALATLISFAGKWQYSRWNLAHYLAELETDTLVLHGYGDLREIQQQLREGTLNIDEDSRIYFQFGLLKTPLPPQKSLSTRLKEWFHLSEPEHPVALNPERAVALLEKQLEIPYEHDNC